MTDDLSTKLAELTDARPEPADPAAGVRLRIKRTQVRRRGTGAVLVTAAATAAVLIGGPSLGTFRSGGADPGVAGPGPVTTATPPLPTATPSQPPSGPQVLPAPWSDKVFTKLPEANAYRPKAYYVAEGRIATEQWSVLAFSDDGRSAGCLVTEEGPANSFGRPLSCFDEWPPGRRAAYLLVPGRVREKESAKIDATMVLGAVSADARSVRVRTSTGRTYGSAAVGTPVSGKLRFFAVVLPAKDVRITSVEPLDAAGRPVGPPTGLAGRATTSTSDGPSAAGRQTPTQPGRPSAAKSN